MAVPEHILKRFNPCSEAHMSRMLEPPAGPVRLILDTDTANEIDDQFALAWTLLSPSQLELEGVTAEPFSFQHHRPRLLQAHRLMTSGGPSTVEEAELVSTYRSWLAGLASVGKDPADVKFVPPDEGMELSYQEILLIYDKLGLSSEGQVYRGAPNYLERVAEFNRRSFCPRPFSSFVFFPSFRFRFRPISRLPTWSIPPNPA